MERLMVIRLAAQGCTAEAWFNGLPMACATPAAPEAVVPAHEAALAGANRLELVVGPDDLPGAPPPQPAGAAPQAMAAQLQLLLPRLGGTIDDTQARTLAQIDWSCAAGEAFAPPVRLPREADLPIRFPRWRWLDAPVLQATPALQRQAHAFVTGLGRDLARGQTESFMAATRLRTEELALAYQRSPDSEAARLREWLEQMYAAARLVWQPVAAEEMQLRPLAGGRLLECLGPEGRAALTTMPDKAGATLALPLKVSVVEGRFYVLR